MSYENVDIVVESTDVPTSPLENVNVRIFNEAGTHVYGQYTTDTLGTVACVLPTGIYQVRCYKMGVALTATFIEVLDTQTDPTIVNKFTIRGEVFVYPQATHPRLCQASGFFITASGAVARNVDINFIAKFKPLILEDNAVLTERIAVKTDSKGYAAVTLLRNGQYDVTIEGMEDSLRCVSVPDQPWVNISHLIFPRVLGVEFDPVPTTLAVGESFTTNVRVSTTSRDYLTSISEDVSWFVSDDTVVSLEVGDGTITLKGLKTGTTNLNATRKDESIIAIPNTPVLNGVTPIVVT